MEVNFHSPFPLFPAGAVSEVDPQAREDAQDGDAGRSELQEQSWGSVCHLDGSELQGQSWGSICHLDGSELQGQSWGSVCHLPRHFSGMLS